MVSRCRDGMLLPPVISAATERHNSVGECDRNGLASGKCIGMYVFLSCRFHHREQNLTLQRGGPVVVVGINGAELVERTDPVFIGTLACLPGFDLTTSNALSND